MTLSQQSSPVTESHAISKILNAQPSTVAGSRNYQLRQALLQVSIAKDRLAASKSESAKETAVIAAYLVQKGILASMSSKVTVANMKSLLSHLQPQDAAKWTQFKIDNGIRGTTAKRDDYITFLNSVLSASL